jgi:hypothetical protein
MPKAQHRRRGRWRYVEEEEDPPPEREQTVLSRLKEDERDGCLVTCCLGGLDAVDCCCGSCIGALVLCCCCGSSCQPSCRCFCLYLALGVLALILILGLAPPGPFATVQPSDYLRVLFSSKLT